MSFARSHRKEGDASFPERTAAGRTGTHQDTGGGQQKHRPSRRGDDARSHNSNSVGRWSRLDYDRTSSPDYCGKSHSWTNSRPRQNRRGFYGDMRQDRVLELELFGCRTADGPKNRSEGVAGDQGFNFDEVDVETSGRDIPDCIERYSTDTIGKDLARNVWMCGYTRPTPIQKYSIACGKTGRDLMACSATGSGKTAGYLIPTIAAMISKGGAGPFPKSPRRCIYPEVLVLAPTRELASQIDMEARRLTYRTGIAPAVVYGGAEVRIDQLRRIERGCDLLVATPGRLLDLIERGRVDLGNVHYLVLDEADMMLDMGFEPQIRRIVMDQGMPAAVNGKRQTMMFSATFPSNIQRIAREFLREHIFLSIGHIGSAPKTIAQEIEYAPRNERMEHLTSRLGAIEDGLVVIFVETKRSCSFIEDVLCGKSFPVCSIHGDKTQGEREEALRSFKTGMTPVLVATSVASRGLDIPNVKFVINFHMTKNLDDYVHRIGRTGRAGSTGSALTFVDEEDFHIIRKLREFLAENDQNVPVWLEELERPKAQHRRKPRENEQRGRPRMDLSSVSHSNRFAQRQDTSSQMEYSARDGRGFLDPTKNDDLLGGLHAHWGVGKMKSAAKPSARRAVGAPSLDADSFQLALPDEDETAAAARIERKKEQVEAKKAAETKKAERDATAAKMAERKKAEDSAEAAAVEAELLDSFARGGRLGANLTQWCARQGPLLPSVEKLVLHLLTEEKAAPDVECEWASPSRYGGALLSLVEESLDGQMQVLWAVQQFCFRLGFPKTDENGEYLVQAMFRAMYKYDLAEDQAFGLWKEDESKEHWDGKRETIVQTLAWFDWLEEEDDEDGDESGELDTEDEIGEEFSCEQEEDLVHVEVVPESEKPNDGSAQGTIMPPKQQMDSKGVLSPSALKKSPSSGFSWASDSDSESDDDDEEPEPESEEEQPLEEVAGRQPRKESSLTPVSSPKTPSRTKSSSHQLVKSVRFSPIAEMRLIPPLPDLSETDQGGEEGEQQQQQCVAFLERSARTVLV